MTDTFTVDPVAPGRFSMSFLRAAGMCLYRAHHERMDDTAGPDALIGRIFHEIAAVVGMRVSMTGEVLDRDLVDSIARRVMGKPEDLDPLSIESYEAVLEILGRWVARPQKHPFEPGEQFEVNAREDLGGRIVSARIDRLLVDGARARVRDYKTGWADPAKELTIQGKVYAWEVFRLYPEVELVEYGEDHVRFGTESGPFEITRADAESFERFLSIAVERIENAYAAGELPATPGTGCSWPTACPVVADCPRREWTKPPGFHMDEAAALEQFEALLVEEAMVEQRKSAIKSYLAAHDQRAIEHDGQEIGWSPNTGKSFDKKALLADLAEKGEAIDPAAYEKTTNPSFGRRNAK